MRGDLVVYGVGPHQLADQLPARTGRADAPDSNAVADLGLDFPQAAVHHLDGPALGPGVDLFHHVPVFVEHHEVGTHRTDVDPQIDLHRIALIVDDPGPDLVSQEGHVLQGERLTHLNLVRFTFPVFHQSLDIRGPRGAGSIALGQGRADGRHPRVVLRHDQFVFRHIEHFAQDRDHARVAGHSADEEGRLADLFALHHTALEIARNGFAQPFQYFGRSVPLLLGVNHIGLGEHGAAAGDLGAPLSFRHHPADLLYRELQPQGLLIEEGPGPGGAVPALLVVGDPDLAGLAIPLEGDVLRVLAPDLEHRAHLRVERSHPARDRPELVFVIDAESFAHEFAT